MTLISSVSGIRGTIGGYSRESLTPIDIVNFSVAYAQWVKSTTTQKPIVVVGRDARVSGAMVAHMVIGSLMGMGIDIIDLGMATTPTVEMTVMSHKAHGGIIITASHNPLNWNALKLLNAKGEFISVEDGQTIENLSRQLDVQFSDSLELGVHTKNTMALEAHIDAILALPLVEAEAVRSANLKIGVDGVNSIGSIAVPRLLERLGVSVVKQIYEEPNGQFQRVAEPLNQHLTGLGGLVLECDLNLGIAVDPDVDRLALVDEKGQPIGEENTLVLVADYVLDHQKGPLVANMSSTMALKDIADKHGVPFFESPVGEVHVVNAMKSNKAVIGGEGNGGVIYPELHYGRDALVGIALLLTMLAKKKVGLSSLVDKLPVYAMRKEKIELNSSKEVSTLLEKLKKQHSGISTNESDGLKIYYTEGWVHVRKSNTEPILRLYAEHKNTAGLDYMVKEMREIIGG